MVKTQIPRLQFTPSEPEFLMCDLGLCILISSPHVIQIYIRV